MSCIPRIFNKKATGRVVISQNKNINNEQTNHEKFSSIPDTSFLSRTTHHYIKKSNTNSHSQKTQYQYKTQTLHEQNNTQNKDETKLLNGNSEGEKTNLLPNLMVVSDSKQMDDSNEATSLKHDKVSPTNSQPKKLITSQHYMQSTEADCEQNLIKTKENLIKNKIQTELEIQKTDENLKISEKTNIISIHQEENKSFKSGNSGLPLNENEQIINEQQFDSVKSLTTESQNYKTTLNATKKNSEEFKEDNKNFLNVEHQPQLSVKEDDMNVDKMKKDTNFKDTHNNIVHRDDIVNKEERDSGVHENEIPKDSTNSSISTNDNISTDQVEPLSLFEQKKQRGGFIFTRTKLSDNKKDEVIPSHKKDEKTRKLIRKAIENNDFLNNYMDDERKERVIDAMEPIEYEQGKFIIVENEEGSEIYVSENGVFEVIKEGIYLDTLETGTIFGELAILYNAKRFVSIKAGTKVKVWKIDRDKFRKIMQISGDREREENLNFLKMAPFLKDFSEEILLKVVDLLKRAFFPTDCCIVRQGEIGNDFFIIRGGTVTIKKIYENGEERVVDRRKKGQYFGEQALLNADCRQASVYADAPGAECLKLDRESFITYLGTIPELKQKPIERAPPEFKRPSVLHSTYDHIEFKDLKKLGTLGAGAFGTVDLVSYKDTNSFALKIIKKIEILKQGQIDHIFNEKKVMAMCQNCPFIVQLYKTYRDSKYIYFLMEACLGGDVWTVMYQKKLFDEKPSRFISGCVVEAFDYLHTRNIIFRDLKPENLMLTPDGYCKLVDFGFAKRLNPNNKTNTFAGTPEYVAPEIILDRGHDRAVDYWTLGILIYELLSGGTPFRGHNQMKIYQKILGGIDVIKFPSRIQKNAQSIIKNLCRQIPAERLGYGKKGIADIRSHNWYSGFDWQRLQNRTMTSPILRPINNLFDTQYFLFSNGSADNHVPQDENSGWDITF